MIYREKYAAGEREESHQIPASPLQETSLNHWVTPFSQLQSRVIEVLISKCYGNIESHTLHVKLNSKELHKFKILWHMCLATLFFTVTMTGQ
jgi:hypothetical protein